MYYEHNEDSLNMECSVRKCGALPPDNAMDWFIEPLNCIYFCYLSSSSQEGGVAIIAVQLLPALTTQKLFISYIPFLLVPLLLPGC